LVGLCTKSGRCGSRDSVICQMPNAGHCSCLCKPPARNQGRTHHHQNPTAIRQNDFSDFGPELMDDILADEVYPRTMQWVQGYAFSRLPTRKRTSFLYGILILASRKATFSIQVIECASNCKVGCASRSSDKWVINKIFSKHGCVLAFLRQG
jgi:hypothetical protein